MSSRPFAKLSFVHSEEILISETPAADPPYVSEQPAPNDPPWGLLPAVGLWFASVLLIVVVPAVFLLPYIATLQGQFEGNEQMVEFAKSDPIAIFLQIVGIIPAHLLTILIAWLIVTQVRRYPFAATLGWKSGSFRWWHYPIILGFFFVIAGFVNYLAPEQENDLIRMLQSSRSAVYIIAFVATFTAPFVEEVVYRGVLYSAFQKRIGVTAAFVLVTFLFAVVHVPQYWPSASTIFLLTLLSLTLTAIRVWSKNLLPCVILHTLFNAIQSAILIVAPASSAKPEIPDPVTAVLRFIGL